MTHKLGKEPTFGLIYIEDWSIFSTSKPLFFDLPTQTDPFYVNQPWYLSSSSPVKSLLIFLRTASSADFSHLGKSFKLHSHLNKHFKALHCRESPCPNSDPQKAYTVLSLLRYTSKSPLRSEHLTVFQLQRLQAHLFVPTPVYSGVASPLEMSHSSTYDHACNTWYQSHFSFCISPRFLFSIERQYTGFFFW